MNRIKSMIVFGTRPEAIKLAPVIRALESDERFDVRVAVTGQHREMLDQVLDVFGIRPHHDLNLMRHGQTPGDIVTGVLKDLDPILESERPDIVLVHGDTISTFAASLASFFRKVPVAHVEAGLRTDDPYDPFPEEMDRRLTGVLAHVHFAPTPRAKANLLSENVDPERIYLTGNTVVDALLGTVRDEYVFDDPSLEAAVSSGRRILLVTTHRRENLGEPMRRIYRAFRELVDAFDDVEIVFAVHKNPAVRKLAEEMLGGVERIRLIEPPGYREFVHLLAASTLVLTDSGGLQEEAPSLGKPVLVLRETTERPEGVEAGTSVRVGTQTERIVRTAASLLTDPDAYGAMAKAVNPYGDGEASTRVKEALLHTFEMGPRPADFRPFSTEKPMLQRPN